MPTSRVDTRNISLGLGVLEFGDYVNDAFVAYRDVGAIKAVVTVTYTREMHPFESGRPLVMLKHEVLREGVTVAATLAEITVANMKSALGGGTLTSSVTPTFMDATSIAPAGDLSSSVQAVGISDVWTMGGQCDVNRLALRFTHLKSCTTGKRQILEVFRAVPSGTLAMPFNETDWNQSEVTFTGEADTTRVAGKQIMQFIIERD